MRGQRARRIQGPNLSTLTPEYRTDFDRVTEKKNVRRIGGADTQVYQENKTNKLGTFKFPV